ncbi:MAG: PPOX class F420-dependent oxidoreductase [Chloroflexi bacterium]|nr:PPOX class F420-dependent oxidoreductase [Chloroflexota bacterium]
MSVFTDKEIEYLRSQKLGRLATVDGAGELHVVPVGFSYDEADDTIIIGGPILRRTRKYRDAVQRRVVAFVVDDVPPPWQPRGIEIRGEAHAADVGGRMIHPDFPPDCIRITARKILSWGIEGPRQRMDPSERRARVVGQPTA